MRFGGDIENFNSLYKVSLLARQQAFAGLAPCDLSPYMFYAGSKDDLGDFSKDSLQDALSNANLLHERGTALYHHC